RRVGERLRDLVERGGRARERVAVGLEVDRDRADHAGHRGGELVGAAVVILEAVLRLGLVGALVGRVGDAVVVVVGIGAAVVVLEVVLVLGLVRALVGRVGDAVAGVVGIGAAVVILEAVLVLGLLGALVLRAD